MIAEFIHGEYILELSARNLRGLLFDRYIKKYDDKKIIVTDLLMASCCKN